MREVQTDHFFSWHSRFLFTTVLGGWKWAAKKGKLVGAEQTGAGCCWSRHELASIVPI
jgi:hypothetical protein